MARAFLKDATFLVLDEPTAHLDEQSATTIERSLDQLTTGRTALFIAHRDALAARADRCFKVVSGQISAIEPSSLLLKPVPTT